MSESFETIVSQILLQNPAIPREELLSLVERKKQESHGLLSDEGAIRLVAQQMSLATFPTQKIMDQRISSVQAGLMDVSISGEVAFVSGLSVFRRSDGSPGKVLRIILAGASGQINCSLWDSMAEFAAEQGLNRGSRVRLEHGYTRYGRGAEVQYHLGQEGSIQPLCIASPLNADSLRVGSLVVGEDLRQNSLCVRIRRILPARSDRAPVQALCEDESGLLIVKFWEDSSKAVLSKEGATIRIQNARVLERNGLLNVNVGNGSLLGEEAQSPASPSPIRLGNVQPGSILRVVQGKVLERGEVRDIETREQRRVKVSNLKIGDQTGRILVTLWDRHAETVDSLRIGDMVRLTAVKIRKAPFTGEPEASTIFLSEIEKIQPDFE